MSYLDRLLGKNEVVVRRTRRHWLSLVAGALLNGVIAILLLVAAGWLAAVADRYGKLATVPAVLLALIALLFVARLVLVVARWWNEIYVLTNRRIVQVEGVFNKLTVDSSLDKINDVVLSQSALGRVLGYGDLEILTASEFGVNKLLQLAGALAFKTDMLNQKESLRQSELAHPDAPGGAGAPTADLSDLMSELEEMHQKGLISQSEYEEKRASILKRM